MPSIGYYFGLMLAKVIIFWISFKKVPMFPFSQKNLNNNEKDKKQRPNIQWNDKTVLQISRNHTLQKYFLQVIFRIIDVTQSQKKIKIRQTSKLFKNYTTVIVFINNWIFHFLFQMKKKRKQNKSNIFFQQTLGKNLTNP